MKHTLTTLALAAAFGLALPATATADPRGGRDNRPQMSDSRHYRSGPSSTFRSGYRSPGYVSAPRLYHYQPGYVRGGPYSHGPRYLPRAGPPVRHPHYYGPPRRGLLGLLFGL